MRFVTFDVKTPRKALGTMYYISGQFANLPFFLLLISERIAGYQAKERLEKAGEYRPEYIEDNQDNEDPREEAHPLKRSPDRVIRPAELPRQDPREYL